MVGLPVDTFSVRRSMRAVPRADHISHLEGVSPSDWQAMLYNRVRKEAEGGRNLYFLVITFVTPDSASHLIDASRNIVDVGQFLFPILVSWAPPFEETLDWLQFVYTVYRTGSYVVPASTVLFPYAVS